MRARLTGDLNLDQANSAGTRRMIDIVQLAQSWDIDVVAAGAVKNGLVFLPFDGHTVDRRMDDAVGFGGVVGIHDAPFLQVWTLVWAAR